MPCRDYEDDHNYERGWEASKEQRDKLARIACNALTALEFARPGKLGVQLALKDAEVEEKHITELLTWWNQHKKDDEAQRRKVEAENKAQNMIQGALAKLNPAERKVLEERGLLSLPQVKTSKSKVIVKAKKTKANG